MWNHSETSGISWVFHRQMTRWERFCTDSVLAGRVGIFWLHENSLAVCLYYFLKIIIRMPFNRQVRMKHAHCTLILCNHNGRNPWVQRTFLQSTLRPKIASIWQSLSKTYKKIQGRNPEIFSLVFLMKLIFHKDILKFTDL